MVPDHSLVEVTPLDELRRRLYGVYATSQGHDALADPADHALIHQILPRLPSSRSARILEVGCGSGGLLARLAKAGYRDVHGIDVSPEQVALARRRGVANVTQEDLKDHLETHPSAYDAIVALDVLEHFRPEEVLPVLDRFADSLRPGGRIIARTPNGVSPFVGRYRYGDLTHGTAFTSQSLNQALGATGFKDIRFFPVNPVPHGPVSVVRRLLWAVIASAMRLALAAETGVARGHIVTQNLIVTARR